MAAELEPAYYVYAAALNANGRGREAFGLRMKRCDDIPTRAGIVAYDRAPPIRKSDCRRARNAECAALRCSDHLNLPRIIKDINASLHVSDSLVRSEQEKGTFCQLGY